MNANRDSRAGTLESVAHWGGITVVAGLVLEVVLVFVFPNNRSCTEIALTALSGALVACGVYTEIHFGREAGSLRHAAQLEAEDKLRISNENIAATMERAAVIERMTAWRRIEESKEQALVAALIPFAAQMKLLVEYQRGDPEAYLYAREMLTLFNRAGAPHLRLTANSYLEADVFDTWLCAAPSIDVTGVVAALTTAGIYIRQWNAKDLSKHLVGANQVAPNVYIFVGAKLPEFMRPNAQSEIATVKPRDSSI